MTTPVMGGATAGSLCLVGSETRRPNSAVSRLLDAGCVLLGTANLAQWANFRSSPETEECGWSSRGGQGYGAYAERMDPSGSSSGSAVAADIGMCLLAVGTEVCVCLRAVE